MENREIKFRAEIKYSLKCGIIQYNVKTRLPKILRKGYKGWYKENGYIMRLVDDHPFRNKRGYVSEHRLIMEQYLSRFLEPNEFMHHIDGNRENNNLDNLRLYNGQSDHARHHANKSKRRKNGQFQLNDSEFETNKYRLFNLDTGLVEFRTLGNLINTTFRKGKYEYRGKWTGLKDKNGKEIYEGDVVKYEIWHGAPEHTKHESENPEHSWEYPYQVIFEKGTYFIKQSCLEHYPETTELRYALEGEGVEIIGNIYENPELIKI